jgi:hypothetical protein
VGACKAGSQTCVGGQWGPCLGGVGPKLEVCANASVLDDDCDGELDDELDKLEWFCDGDSDGFAAIGASPVKSCAPPLGGCEGPNPVWGLNLPTTDCQDSNVAINPNALEICDEGLVDNNCNGLANEGCSCANGKTQACFQDFSGATIPSVNGAAVGACKAGSQTCYSGQWGPCVGGLGPQPETCGNLGKDNDCDGDSAEADDKPTYYCDADNDGFLSVNQATVKTAQQCGGPPAPGTLGCAGTWRPLGTPFLDCNDGSFNINPNATEICDAAQVDENCNGQKNEGCSCQNGQTQPCFVTAQGAIIPNNNGVPVGECKAGTQTCAGGQWGSCTGGVGPAPETCANIGKDNDCDGDTTDADDKSTYFCDPDSDNFLDKNKAPLSLLVCGGAPAAGSNGCVGAWRPQGTPFTDCGEGNPAINPNGVEVCDATLLDENCNGQINEGCSCINGTTTDCGAQATCNFVQNGAVCKSGVYDLAAVCKTPRAKQNFCPDLDSDGYCGTLSNCLDYCPAGTLPSEGPLPPGGWKLKTSCVGVGENKVDCQDNQSGINPGATELCGDGIDSNCASGDSDGYNVGASCNVGGLSVGACAGGGANACSAPGSTQTVCNANHPDIGKAKAQTFQAPNGSWDWSCDGNVTTSASVNKTSCGGGICFCPQTLTNFTYPPLLAACKNGSNLQPGDISGAPFVNRVCGPNLNNLDSICQGLGLANCADTIVYIDTMCGGACGSAPPSCGKTIAAVRCTNTSGACKSTNYQGGICNTPYETFVMACQ